MGMIAYEVSPHRSGPMSYLTLSQVLTGRMPYLGCDDAAALLNIRGGKIPERPPEAIADPVWRLLEKCWSTVPSERPPASLVYNFFSELRSIRGKSKLQDHFGQSNSQTRGTSTGPSSIGVSHDPPNAPRRLLSDEPHASSSNSSNANGGYPLSITQGGVAERRTGGAAEVTRLVISSSSSDHTSTVGARALGSTAGGGRRHRTSLVASPHGQCIT